MCIRDRPCCYRPRHGSKKSSEAGPAVLEGVLGRGVHADVLRTQRLHAEGYAVEWTAIPACVTPKNRVIVGKFGRAL